MENQAPASAPQEAPVNQDNSHPNPEASQNGNGSGLTDIQKIEQEFFEVPVNGKIKKMTRQEAINAAAQVEAAHERFREAAELRKKNEEIEKLFSKDVISAFKQKGYSNEQIQDQIERWYHQNIIEPQTLTPEQRRLKEYEEKLAAYKQKEEEEAQNRQRQEQDQLTAKQRDYLSNQIIQGLERGGLAKTEFNASRMAFYMKQNLIQGWEAPIDVIVQQVKKENQDRLNGEIGTLKGQQLVDYLGEAAVEEVIKYHVDKMRQRKQNVLNGSSPSNGDYGSSLKPKEKVYSSDVNRNLRRMSGKIS